VTAYAIVTPARDEAENLRRLAACVAAQTAQPAEWMIVDDGSIDGTLELARELERRHDWVRVVARPRGAPLADGRRDGRPLLAFEAGAAALRTRPEVVVKLDADVSMPPDHLAAIVAAFAADPQLGIASGVRFERERGAWRRQYVTGTSVESPIRAYRRRCLEEIAPIEARFYWDGIDEVKARLRGWRTAILEDAGFRHHRAMGARDSGRARAWALEGRGSHYMGYRPSYLFIRSLFQARRDPAALAMLWGYAAAAAGPDRRYPDPGVRAYVRRQQSLRRLPMRAREALGRSRPRPGRRTWRSPA
jgi:biofilm PGA synthesis N-glycosyltransferase PgaC